MRPSGHLGGCLVVGVILAASAAYGQCERAFRRGDVNQDGQHNISDGVGVLNWLFVSGRAPDCLDSADANDSGTVDIADPVYSFQRLFAGGPDIPRPGDAECGGDPTPDELDCAVYVGCPDGDVCPSNDCCPDGFYCAKPEGECRGPGECRERPGACPRIWDPVCGCDGKTYGNACEAAAAGVNVAHRGECGMSCRDHFECPDGFYCAKEPGDCDGVGECREIPMVVNDVWAPVCGCDGVTYMNDGFAAMAGVNVAYSGRCEPDRCRDIFDCRDGYYCAKAEGDCDGLGDCRPRPEACPDIWDPVCGCDGKTYGNECEAAAAGVNISHTGPCEG